VAIEGFGTGYSSLGHLRRSPVDRLAVDRTFVEALGAPGVEGALAEGVVALATSLHLETAAEGIDDARQVAALVARGCRLGWGPFYAEPLPADGLGALLARGGALRPSEPSFA
jgi:sensor c-di-GMP phosphodiesterase-like protein